MSWIELVDLGVPKGRKTKRWEVRSRQGASVLGYLQWFSPWRRYCFYPDAYAVFEQDCLREIADFIEAKTTEHKQRG